ncbi:hypothetical protein HK099_002504 [Clydaea vesicula]|uniref:GYF domain-containing protein n=1 Tax=Clydaea vesicula TaxID=447962 RepID=A0AAD5U2W7_9FUNG|nr:hypothetical protein HK099_002504 [Clydaea vesicula]
MKRELADGIEYSKKKVKFSEVQKVNVFNDNDIVSEEEDEEDLNFGAEKKNRKEVLNIGNEDSEESEDEKYKKVDVFELENKPEEGDMVDVAAIKKKKRNLDKSTLQGEGQEWNRSEDDEEDEVFGAPQIIPFNMDRDLEEGDIDAEGHYIKKNRDENQIHDSWLNGLTKKDFKKAKLMHERKIARQRIADFEKNGDVGVAEENSANKENEENLLWCGLLEVLRPQETVLSCLARFKPAEKKKNWHKNKHKIDKASKQEEDLSSAEKQQNELQRTSTIEKLSTICEKLMSIGHHDVYELRYEQIVRKLRIAEVLDDNWVAGDPVPLHFQNIEVKKLNWFEYKINKTSTEIFGPFNEEEMRNWSEQGFFATMHQQNESKDENNTDHGVFCRQVTLTSPLDLYKDFKPIQEFNFFPIK